MEAGGGRAPRPRHAQGRFTIPADGAWKVVCATAEGRGLALAHVRMNAPKVTLRLRAPRTVTGRAFLPDGAPAAGVRVRPVQAEEEVETNAESGWPGNRKVTIPAALQELRAGVVAADGSFRLEGLPPGKLWLEVADPRFVTEKVPVEGSEAQIRLRAGCRIRGRVLAGDKVLAGWAITAHKAGEHVPAAARARTGADGAFLLSAMPPGDYFVEAHAPGELRLVADASDVPLVAPAASVSVREAQPDAETTFRATTGGVVAGRVVDATTKAPIAETRVRVRGVDVPAQSDGSAELRTGQDGIFRVRVPAGPAQAYLTTPAPEGYPLPNTKWDVVVKEGEETPLEIALQPGLILAGRVVDAAGKPAAGARLFARWGHGFGWAQATAADDGTFRLRGLPDGEVTVTASRGEDALLLPATFKPPFPTEARLEIGPRPQIAIVGRVVDDTGRPAAGVPVRLQRMRADDEYRSGFDAGAAATDKDGRFRFAGLDIAFRYFAGVASEDYRIRGGGQPTADAGPERRLTDLVVIAFDQCVAGRVRNARGQPVPGAVVFWSAGTSRHRVLTDAEGRFRIDGLPNRPVCLVAHDGKGAAAIARAVPGEQTLITLTE